MEAKNIIRITAHSRQESSSLPPRGIHGSRASQTNPRLPSLGIGTPDCELLLGQYNRQQSMSPLGNNRLQRRAFTLVELLAVVAIVAIVASFLFPALSQAKGKAHSITCMNNQRQLAVAWSLYAQDNSDRLANNYGAAEIKQLLSRNQNVNWAGSVLNWELTPDNTNHVLNTRATLGRYLAGNAAPYRCPSDFSVSGLQRSAGWTGRCRSISMNAMVGDAGEFTRGGSNVNNPTYIQYLRMSDFLDAARIFVFIEEHPDSINDGYFLNKIYSQGWHDLPASYHAGAANLVFGDGHAEIRRWQGEGTKAPAKPDAVVLPMSVTGRDKQDFKWLLTRTTTALH